MLMCLEKYLKISELPLIDRSILIVLIKLFFVILCIPKNCDVKTYEIRPIQKNYETVMTPWLWNNVDNQVFKVYSFRRILAENCVDSLHRKMNAEIYFRTTRLKKKLTSIDLDKYICKKKHTENYFCTNH